MRVVPQESERCADEGAAKNRKLADFGDVLDVKIGSPAKVAADVSKYREGSCSDDRAADGQAVETVGEVHGVRGANQDEADKNEKWDEGEPPPVRRFHQRVNHEIRMKALRKRNYQLRRVSIARQQHQERAADDKADYHLKIDFFLRREAQVLLLRDFRVVVNEADDRESGQRKERDQNERIRQIGPQ